MNKLSKEKFKEEDLLRDQEIAETTALFVEYLRSQLADNPSRRLKGYLLLEDPIRLIHKKDIYPLCVLEGDTPPPARQGSIICTGTHNPIHRGLTACFIGYQVQLNLEKEAQEYPYKKFEIDFEYFWEWRYYKNKLIRFKREEYKIPFLKVDIIW